MVIFMPSIVISLGGSVIIPDKLDTKFLGRFNALIRKYPKNRFVIICGGGKLARDLQKMAEGASEKDLDWLGIYATRMNALSLKKALHIRNKIITNPNEPVRFIENVVIAAGWKPGFSTDYDAVLLAKNIGADTVINMTNVDYVYDQDPKLKGAKPIKETTWNELRKLVGSRWTPGLNMPFDPVASKEAERLKMKVVVVGKDLRNLENLFNKKRFKGTVIR